MQSTVIGLGHAVRDLQATVHRMQEEHRRDVEGLEQRLRDVQADVEVSPSFTFVSIV